MFFENGPEKILPNLCGIPVLNIPKTTAMTDILTARHKKIRLDWCEMFKIALMVKLWLFEDWLISEEVRVSLDGKDVP